MSSGGIQVDFTGITPASRSTIPSGTYPMRVTELNWSETSTEPKRDMLTVTLKVEGGPMNGREQRRNFFFVGENEQKTKTVLGFLLQFLAATGRVPEEKLTGKVKVTAADIAKVQGALVAVRVTQKPAKAKEADYADDEGKVNNISGIYHIDSAVGKTALAAKDRNPLAPRR
jgi:hypothetical protein